MNYTYKYPRYKITCDIACIHDNKLLIIKRGAEPCVGKYALPGGNLDPDELLEDCARREVFEETGIWAEDLTLLGNFDRLDRAPGDRSVSCVYISHFQELPDVIVGDDATDYRWISKDEIDSIDFAFDCRDMAIKALAS